MDVCLRCCAVRSAVALVAGFVNGDSSCCGFAEVAMGHATEFRQQWAWISDAYSSQRTAGYEELRVIVPLGCVLVTGRPFPHCPTKPSQHNPPLGPCLARQHVLGPRSRARERQSAILRHWPMPKPIRQATDVQSQPNSSLASFLTLHPGSISGL